MLCLPATYYIKYSPNTAQDSTVRATTIRNLLITCICDVSYFFSCWINRFNNKQHHWRGDKNISRHFILCPEALAVFNFHKVNIERGKHLALMSLLSHICGQNALFALTSACGHEALFAQLIMHVDHRALFAQDGAEMKVWEVRKDSFDIWDILSSKWGGHLLMSQCKFLSDATFILNQSQDLTCVFLHCDSPRLCLSLTANKRTCGPTTTVCWSGVSHVPVGSRRHR